MRSLSKSKWMEAVQSYVLYFFFYSVLGWLYEVFLEVVVYRWGFTNRGVLLGPYCPVYGVGALVFLLAFSRLMAKRAPGPGRPTETTLSTLRAVSLSPPPSASD